jgi:hypothetical protein
MSCHRGSCGSCRSFRRAVAQAGPGPPAAHVLSTSIPSGGSVRFSECGAVEGDRARTHAAEVADAAAAVEDGVAVEHLAPEADVPGTPTR